MTALLIGIPTACYAIASVTYAAKGNWPMCIVYAGYAAANVGLIAVDLRA